MPNRTLLQLCRDDSKAIRGLLAQLIASDVRAQDMKPGIVRELFMMAEIYGRLEREILFPALLELLPEEHRGVVGQCIQDDQGIEEMVDRMRSTGITNIRLNELIHSVTDHFTREEEELFPAAEKVLGDQDQRLGEEAEERQRELMSLPEYEDSVPWKVQNPSGGEQKRKVS